MRMSVFHMADVVYSQLPHRKLSENLNSSCRNLFRPLQPDGTPDSGPTTAVVSDGVPRFSSNQSVRTDPAQTHNTCPTLQVGIVQTTTSAANRRIMKVW